ncbi:hypothetical protein [Fodinibius sp.]|uniref:hypothetical protein n=1 Tax=Fodinibius sp. TaxID=1872440 RepID=UPI002ACDF966|nr:hypothetical protein [Fodinibius sp.]MDZ7659474.1 hypothetical protein [Fodinibius sp.]
MKLQFLILLFSLLLFQACATQSIVKKGEVTELEQFLEKNRNSNFQLVLQNGETVKTNSLKVTSNDTLVWSNGKSSIQQIQKVKAKRIKIATVGVLAAGLGTILFTSLPPPNCKSDSCTGEQLGQAYGNILYKTLVGLATVGGVLWIESNNPQRVFILNKK